MEKRILIAFLLSFLFLSVWNRVFIQKSDQKGSDVFPKIENKGDSLDQSPVSSSNMPTEDVVPAKPPEKVETVVLENDVLRVELTNVGAAISDILLKKYNYSLPVENLGNIVEFDKMTYNVLTYDDQGVVFSLKNRENQIFQKYSFRRDSPYVIDVETKIVQSEEMSNLRNVQFSGFKLDISRLDKKTLQSRNRSLMEIFFKPVDKKIVRKGNAFKFSNKDNQKEDIPLSWLGFRDRYFGAVVKPQFTTSSYQKIAEGACIYTNPETQERLDVTKSFPSRDLCESAQISSKDGGGYEWFYDLKVFFSAAVPPLSKGKDLVLKTSIYYGPQDMSIIKGTQLNIENFMVYSNWGLIDFVAKGINKLIFLIHRAVSSWGISIILMAVAINLLMYPLTKNSMTSMRKLQAIQPQLKKLQEQYKNNPQKLQKETMELYKENKVNPMGGCLPIFLQMPIFFGMYQVLWRSIEFKGASFLWIKDLSEPDRLFILHSQYPFIGHEINILPIGMIFLMFLQQKFSSRNMVSSDPNQVAQQKMMMLFFPVLIGFIFYKVASGLALYFTIFYIFSIFGQLRMSKMKK